MLSPYQGGIFRVSQKFTLGTHNGIDVVGVSSKNLIAVCNGTVYQSRIVTNKNDLTWQWGNYITLKADTGELITYAHLSKRLVSQGQRVRVGDVIGVEGNTGYSFGSHCHLEVRGANNRVSDKINSPIYTEIPNKVGRYTLSDGKEKEELTKEEVQKMIDDAIAANSETVYRYFEQLPDWAHDPIKALYDNNLFYGIAADDLDLSESLARTLVVVARALKAQGRISY